MCEYIVTAIHRYFIRIITRRVNFHYRHFMASRKVADNKQQPCPPTPCGLVHLNKIFYKQKTIVSLKKMILSCQIIIEIQIIKYIFFMVCPNLKGFVGELAEIQW